MSPDTSEALPETGVTGHPTPLKPPSRWHDPLRLIENEAPNRSGRIVLWAVCILIFILIVWAALGQLDIIATAEGKLVPRTLVKIVQPAEAGVIKEILVEEGDEVRQGQILARLDTTLASADKAGIANDLAIQDMQARRIEAQLSDQPMLPQAGDNAILFAEVQGQYAAQRKAYLDSLDQEQSLLAKAQHEKKSAGEIFSKLEQTLPSYRKTAEAFGKLEQDGFVGNLAAAEKRREALEKAKDLDAQRATVAALEATIAAQNKRIDQLKSAYKNELQKELADVRARIAQLQPNLAKTSYREGLMELHAPQDGVIKGLSTTTQGAVVQPGSILMTLVPRGEQLFADVEIRNEDVGFVQVGQTARVKLAAYPFQKYGMLEGIVIRVSADASDDRRTNGEDTEAEPKTVAPYAARIRIEQQSLTGPRGSELPITPGMQVVAEIHQGKRTVMEYLLSPVQKTVNEAGRER
jgi:hemolysin D